MKMLGMNRKFTVSLFVMIVLVCGVGGVSYAADPPAVKLQVETEQALTEGNSKSFVVMLLLEGAAWEGISEIRSAVSVSGIDGVKIKTERYNTGRTTRVWVCTANCGGWPVEWGYWENRAVYSSRPVIQRKSDTVLEVPLTFDGTDFGTDATLTFTVKASAIADYEGASLTAITPVIAAVSAPSPLTEQNLGVNVVRFTITGGRYAAPLPDSAVTVAGIAGVGVSDVVRKSDTVFEVSLAFDGTDFDTDATLTFTVSPDTIANDNSVPVTARIPVTAIKEVLSASVVSPLTEATLNGSTIELSITGTTFEDIAKIRDAVLVTGVDGVTIDTATAERLNDRKITVELDYDGTDLIRDTTLTFTITSEGIANHNGEVTTEIPVTANRNEDILFIYFTDSDTDKIQRANLDMANLDVSNVEDLVTEGLDGPDGIALDVAGGKMYWTDAGTDKIQRANFDGSNREDLVTGLDGPGGIALDVSGGKMYWTGAGIIQRANLDGSNREDLVTRASRSGGIALDIASGKMYWTTRNHIRRANFDGSNIEVLVDFDGRKNGESGHPRGIALDVVGGKMYYTLDNWYNIRGEIQRANFDGSNIEKLVTLTQRWSNPGGIALDVVGGKMYWTDYGTDKIQRANFDGSNVEDLVTGLDSPRGIAIVMSSLVDPTKKEPAIAKEDVNRDGVVDVNDLAYVGLQYGQTGTNIADVNGDGVVNVDDLILVAAAVDAAAAAPAARALEQTHFTETQLQGWLAEARASGNTSRAYQRGVAVIEQLLALFTPEKTALLANYPNPFNPETWIPYQLSEPTNVRLTLYDINGRVVRDLDLGLQRAGKYESRSRAAYWDGRNAVGEPVASGVYFYTLTAGDFIATRKMLIRK